MAFKGRPGDIASRPFAGRSRKPNAAQSHVRFGSEADILTKRSCLLLTRSGRGRNQAAAMMARTPMVLATLLYDLLEPTEAQVHASTARWRSRLVGRMAD
jgi:hypothetical protein